MKLSILYLAATPALTCGFAGLGLPREAVSLTSSSSALAMGATPDTTAAIQAATAASKQFGATSPEARVAWDVVEEMNASDNSAAYQKSQAVYFEVHQDQKKPRDNQLSRMAQLAEEMSAIKIHMAESVPAAQSPAVVAALQTAQEATAAYGSGSAEARVAWAELEEVSSSGLENAMGARLDEECLVESGMEVCLALEELNRVLTLQMTRDEGLGDFA